MRGEGTIRPERTADAVAVRAVARMYLGLVATDGDAVIGHILFTSGALRDDQAPHTVMALAPMSVLPTRQRRGVGSALVRAGLQACRVAGHDVVIVVGHPAYYPRFGFVRARPLGLTSEPPFPDESFMVAELTPGALRGRRGVVVYGEEFGSR